MKSVEIEVEDRTKPLEELEKGLSSSNFVDIVAPEDMSDEFDRIESDINSYNGKLRLNAPPMAFGIISSVLTSFFLPFSPTNWMKALTVGSFATLGASYKIQESLRSNLDDLDDEREDLREMSENWYELPGVVDLSYLADQGLESEFERPYREWLDENISDWEDQALPADLALQELDALEGIDHSEDYNIDVSAFDYGVQRVYLEELDEKLNEEVDGDHYKFVLQTYDELEDGELNSYWGITDGRGRRIVEENGGVKTFSIDEKEQLNRE